METLWFCIAWGMWSTFVVLGGTDIGVGILHLFVGRAEDERGEVIRSIHTVWKPNEVWLVATGGILFVAFPQLLAVGLSGFYLALMIVLWLLVFRGLGIELRDRVADRMWREFWDVAFCGSSWLLALCLGAALGNLVRGVPLDREGNFFEPLWTDFLVGPRTGILDWYTILIGITAVLVLAHHGALWLCAFAEGPVRRRSSRWAAGLWVAAVLALIVAASTSFVLQPQVGLNAAAHPWGVLFPVAAALALFCSRWRRRRGRWLQAYIASGASLYAGLSSAAFGLYPYVLPARDSERGLTAIAAAAPRSGLQLALSWWIPGILLVSFYLAYIYSHLQKRSSVEAGRDLD